MLQTLCKPEIPKIFSERVKVGNLLLDICRNDESPDGHSGGVDCNFPIARTSVTQNGFRIALQPQKYIHQFMLLELISWSITFQLHKTFIWKFHFPIITLHVVICDSENYMDKLLRSYSLRISHCSCIKECFRISSAIISDWSASVKSFLRETKDTVRVYG